MVVSEGCDLPDIRVGGWGEFIFECDIIDAIFAFSFISGSHRKGGKIEHLDIVEVRFGIIQERVFKIVLLPGILERSKKRSNITYLRVPQNPPNGFYCRWLVDEMWQWGINQITKLSTVALQYVLYDDDPWPSTWWGFFRFPPLRLSTQINSLP